MEKEEEDVAHRTGREAISAGATVLEKPTGLTKKPLVKKHIALCFDIG